MSFEQMPPYPLAEVLDVKHRRVDTAERELQEKQRLLDEELVKLRECERARDKVKKHRKDKLDQLRQKLDKGTTSDKIDQGKLYLKVVDERLAAEEKKVANQKNQVDLARKNVEIAKNQLKDRERERDKIITHRKEWTKEVRKELQVLATREEDEIGTTMFLTKMIQERDNARRKE